MLRISFPPIRVYVDHVRMQPKVAPVLALMAVRTKQYPPEHAWVSAAEVSQLPDWRNSKSKSVGTEVYNAFRRLGLQQSGLVESPHLGKVAKWRLRASTAVNWQPGFDSVAKAIYADVEASDKPALLTEVSSDFTFATKSRIDRNDVLKHLLESHPNWELLRQQHLRKQSAARTGLNRANWLAQQARMLLHNGDSSTAATLFNAAGCIANSEHAYEDAKHWLLTAIPLLLAHGALVELEAALMNLSVNSAQRNEPPLTAQMAETA